MTGQLFISIMVVSIGLQLTAAVFSVLNTRFATARLPWIMLAVAMGLMALRRILSLCRLECPGATATELAWGPELTALAISVLSLAGMVGLRLAVRRSSAALREKDLLLKSSLHQTKNNLQSLQSLIHVQAETVGDQEQRSLMLAMEQKVVVYAALQRLMFETGGSPAADRYLREVAQSVIEAFRAPHRRIIFIDRLQAQEIDTRDLLTAGIVVGEAVTNACKYATSADATAEITVSSGIDEGRRWIQVRDNGPGIADHSDAGARTGFGTVFFQSLTSHTASVTIESRGGTVVRYQF